MNQQVLAVVRDISQGLPAKKIRNRIVLTNTQLHHFIEIDNIVYLKSEGNYCRVILHENGKHLFAKTMKSIFDKLPSDFIKVHKSFVINLQFIKQIDAAISMITMIDNSKIPISRTNKATVKALISSLA